MGITRKRTKKKLRKVIQSEIGLKDMPQQLWCHYCGCDVEIRLIDGLWEGEIHFCPSCGRSIYLTHLCQSCMTKGYPETDEHCCNCGDRLDWMLTNMLEEIAPNDFCRTNNPSLREKTRARN